jgi:hypothetical protein
MTRNGLNKSKKTTSREQSTLKNSSTCRIVLLNNVFLQQHEFIMDRSLFIVQGGIEEKLGGGGAFKFFKT